MTMIPSASILASILNDPSIPASAKPSWSVHHQWMGSEHTVIPCGVQPLAWGELVSDANADLFWSLSAWLWGMGVATHVQPNLPHTPVEGMAELVRQWSFLNEMA